MEQRGDTGLMDVLQIFTDPPYMGFLLPSLSLFVLSWGVKHVFSVPHIFINYSSSSCIEHKHWFPRFADGLYDYFRQSAVIIWLADWFNGSIWFKESFSDSHRPAITGEDEISMTGCISVWGRCWRTAPCPTRRGWRPWRTSWRRPDSWPRRLTGNTMRCRSRACVCWRFCDCSNWSSFEVLY